MLLIFFGLILIISFKVYFSLRLLGNSKLIFWSVKPIMNTLSLFWGILKLVEFKTFQKTLYPKFSLFDLLIFPLNFLDKTFKIFLKVLPLLWLIKPFTFSRIKTFGFFSFKILTISKNKVPLVSSKPFLLPAILNGWHGNPAQRISWFGIFFADNFFISINGYSLVTLTYVGSNTWNIHGDGIT